MSPDLLAALGEVFALFSTQIGTRMDEFPYFLGAVLITVLVVIDRRFQISNVRHRHFEYFRFLQFLIACFLE